LDTAAGEDNFEALMAADPQMPKRKSSGTTYYNEIDSTDGLNQDNLPKSKDITSVKKFKAEPEDENKNRPISYFKRQTTVTEKPSRRYRHRRSPSPVDYTQ